ncbi:M50 family metallopeptidase [Aeromicrobium sp.]|uniref:M50 family metallopeptidase n=1 Tax=Aeromicrobium sp. TaxID=1871063 RepID=UPI0019C47E9D|nr:M50 family metallopeptidase [Aeromicrobium sp.]MBC7630084.1 M50 family metallopeptidase [Aeromicrobium sp.]
MSSSPRPAAPAGTWRIGRVANVDVLIKPSLLVLAVVLVSVLAPRFEDRTDSNPYVLATAFVVALYISVLVHELAHVVVARAFRMRVHSVTLNLLGGETAIEGESRTPWQELATAGSGPLASLAIGMAGFLAESHTTGTMSSIIYSTAYVNIILAIFNMLPGLPLDGGRVFRAIIWQVTGGEEIGIRIAAWLGRVAAVGVVVLVFVRYEGGRQLSIDLLVAALIAWFLWQGASDALRNASRSSRINMLVARDIALAGAPAPDGAASLPASLQGAELLRAMAARPADVYVLTEPDGSIYGVLSSQAVDDAYRESRR